MLIVTILTMSAPLTLTVDMSCYYNETKRKQKGLKVAAKYTLNSTSGLKVSTDPQTKQLSVACIVLYVRLRPRHSYAGILC